jgi:hypothetical protein
MATSKVDQRQANMSDLASMRHSKVKPVKSVSALHYMNVSHSDRWRHIVRTTNLHNFPLCGDFNRHCCVLTIHNCDASECLTGLHLNVSLLTILETHKHLRTYVCTYIYMYTGVHKSRTTLMYFGSSNHLNGALLRTQLRFNNELPTFSWNVMLT